MTMWFRILPVCFAVMLMSGCVSTGSREITDPGLMGKIEKDKTTKAEVSAWLGYPAIVAYGEKGQETWNYYYVTEYPTAADFIPLLNAAMSGLRQNTRELKVTFDRQGVARDLQRRQVAGNPEIYPY
jgi:outer membrane protein assembly factor BamE (lipoprotein component of BamABCDE complex)